jgi:hypothetical protein
MKLALILICVFVLTGLLKSQTNPAIMISLEFSDPVESRTIYFGIDPTATDSLDFLLGEANLPPFPPAPTLETRFLLPIDNFAGTKSTYKDFRNGNIPFSGQKEHRIQFQSRGSLKMFCNLPPEINIQVTDLFGGVILNTNISGIDTLSIPDALNQLKFFINYNNATLVEEEQFQDINFKLSQNYPNPFNPSTNIQFTLNNRQFVRLTIFDSIGREIATLINDEISAGVHNVYFNADGLTNGVYYYRLIAGNLSQTKKMILIK